ncbi:MAG TPA: ABC transporter permease [Candidatus Udaeobacter sp.]|jgi:putative ABC transport system permease protein
MNDVKFAFRQLGKSPGFACVVVLTLALGIGANTAVFSVVNAVLVRPLPFKYPQNLVAVGEYDAREKADPGTDINSVSYLDYVDLRDQNKVFERIAVYTNQGVSTLTDGNGALHIQGESVSADLFPLLGVQPILGRTFLPEEDKPGKHVVILSHAFWRRRLGADRNVVGKPITLNGQQFEIIGVMPPRFTFPIGAVAPELWVSMSSLSESKDGSPPMTEQRDNDFFECIARLKPNTSLQQAQANIDSITARWRHQYPDSKLRTGGKVIPQISAMIGSTHSALLMLCAMAGCVLLVACVNVANLLLARSLSRSREMSIRAALGAGRWRISKQLLVESTLLGALGGLAGLVLAIWGVDALKVFLPSIPRIDEISADSLVLVVTAIASLGVGILSGLLPAWRASRSNFAASLNDAHRGSTEGGSAHRTRAALVVAEIVLALILLASAELLVESFIRLQRVPGGFDPTNVMTARVALSETNYGKPEQAAAFYKRLLERLSSEPGMQSVAAAWWIPLSGSEISFAFNLQAHPVPQGQQPLAQFNAVTPDYFKAMRAPLRKGRWFTERDDQNAPAIAIVTEAFVNQFFPGEDPIGKRLIVDGSVEPGKPPVREIVGVVGDMHLISLKVPPKPQIYVPYSQFAIPSVSIFMRTEVDPGSVITTLKRAIGEIDKDVPVYRPRLLADYRSESIAQPRLNAMLVSLFALIALLLAAAGIFGVMSYSVAQRTQEIGIRVALGAQRYDVLRLIIGQGMRFVGIGLLVGLISVFACTRLFQSLLFGVGATDLETMFIAIVTLATVALCACYIPARRAMRVDPIQALRSE